MYSTEIKYKYIFLFFSVSSKTKALTAIVLRYTCLGHRKAILGANKVSHDRAKFLTYLYLGAGNETPCQKELLDYGTLTTYTKACDKLSSRTSG